MTTRPAPEPRAAFRHFQKITTRWGDNDLYGHVNNAVYTTWFDSVVNRWMIDAGLLDLQQGATVGLVVETRCSYFAPLAYPQDVELGMRVAYLGTSSVRWELGVFGVGAPLSAASGHFIHVCVDRTGRRPQALPASWREALSTLSLPA